MKHFLNFMLSHLLFGGTMFFAAGAPPVIDSGTADAGVDTTADVDTSVDTSTDETSLETADETVDEPVAEQPVAEKKATTEEEPEAAEFAGSVSARLRGMVKRSPQLAAAFKADPKLQAEFEAGFRREAAYREAFPTIAEARQMRETFPNGIQDVQQMQQEVADVEKLDADFYGRDAQGNYPGHEKILAGMAQDDPEATRAFMRSIPRQWAKIDPDGYNSTMGQVIAATLTNDGVPKYVGKLLELAKASKNDALTQGLTELADWMGRFSGEQGKPSPDAEKLANERKAFQQQQAEAQKREGQVFQGKFYQDSKKLQEDIIASHPAIKRLEKNPAISKQKRAEIIEKIRSNGEKFWSNSRSFMGKLKPAYAQRNLDETIKVQRAHWSQQWFLNRMVRDVLKVETPTIVRQNRETAVRRTSPQQRTPVQPQQKKGARQIGGRWYREDGTAYSTAEVLAGKHLS